MSHVEFVIVGVLFVVLVVLPMAGLLRAINPRNLYVCPYCGERHLREPYRGER